MFVACSDASKPASVEGIVDARPLDETTPATEDASTDVRDVQVDSATVVPSPARLAIGDTHTCVILATGRVKCWGFNGNGTQSATYPGGMLGLGDLLERGDGPGEMGSALAAVDLGVGKTATAIALGASHTCAILDDGKVKCWGFGRSGQLGLGDTKKRGAATSDMGDALPTIDLGVGRTATAIAAGWEHTCAILDNGNVKCWGNNGQGSLGLGDSDNRGDSPGEMGDALANINLGAGRTAKMIGAGRQFSCAILDNDTVKCWGQNEDGRLGLGNTNYRGAFLSGMGDALPALDFGPGKTAKALGVGAAHACVILSDNTVRCWGRNANAQLGLGDTSARGSGAGEMGNALAAVDLGSGRTAKGTPAVGYDHTCVILDNDRLKCWGWNVDGGLGLGDATARGSDSSEMGDGLKFVELGVGRTVKAVAAGIHTCALLDNDKVKCWGNNGWGSLGLGDRRNRGVLPGDMGDSLPAVETGN